MNSKTEINHFSRRNFCKSLTLGGLATTFSPGAVKSILCQSESSQEKPNTNIDEALKIPRNENSLPGKYPGRIVNIFHSGSIVNNKPELKVVYEMLKRSLTELTGKQSLKNAWQEFVSPDDIVGLKVNPVAGKMLSTSLQLTKTVIQQLIEAGIPKKNIIIWDRREFQLHEAGFNATNFPGIKITGTEIKDENGSFYDNQGKLYSTKVIDKDWFYWADVNGEYDAETLPYMVNKGKYSYFSKIVTRDITKIINLPILKNAGSTVTLCLKNLAYGAISNTGRLHQQLWSETSAQVPCFVPIRDKVVLNIVDGLKGCYDGGPGANPQFITNYNRLIIGTDPVAADRIGYKIVLNKRLESKIQQEESSRGRIFMDLAERYGLGIAQIEKIDHREINLT
jgi:uncharacterized protein (DUF362 family)